MTRFRKELANPETGWPQKRQHRFTLQGGKSSNGLTRPGASVQHMTRANNPIPKGTGKPRNSSPSKEATLYHTSCTKKSPQWVDKACSQCITHGTRSEASPTKRRHNWNEPNFKTLGYYNQNGKPHQHLVGQTPLSPAWQYQPHRPTPGKIRLGICKTPWRQTQCKSKRKTISHQILKKAMLSHQAGILEKKLNPPNR